MYCIKKNTQLTCKINNYSTTLTIILQTGICMDDKENSHLKVIHFKCKLDHCLCHYHSKSATITSSNLLLSKQCDRFCEQLTKIVVRE